MQNYPEVHASLEALKAKLDPHFLKAKPVGLILGTGLDALDSLLDAESLNYADIPYFPKCSEQSHSGVLKAGYLENLPVIALCGRVHLYEGYSPAKVCHGVRTLRGLGAETLIVTNSAGALNPNFSIPSLMLALDQINFTGQSPLQGPNYEAWGLRFPDLSHIFDPKLINLSLKCALELGITLEKGVYIGVHGPELETPAETKMYRAFGADAIGMSSVLEVIAAKHLGFKILQISCLSNKNLPDCMAEISLEEVIENTRLAAQDLERLLRALAKRMTKV